MNRIREFVLVGIHTEAGKVAFLRSSSLVIDIDWEIEREFESLRTLGSKRYIARDCYRSGLYHGNDGRKSKDDGGELHGRWIVVRSCCEGCGWNEMGLVKRLSGTPILFV
jgi:hypothetical protein